jgi:4-amino-4-deoxy-L-arabinose transferase-like glycosyltransferase
MDLLRERLPRRSHVPAASDETAPSLGARPFSRRDWFWLLTAAAVVRVGVVFGALHALPLVSDAGAYARQAVTMLHRFPGPPDYYWPPGQSLFLLPFYRVFGTTAAVAKVASILIDLGVVALTVLLASRVLRDRRAIFLSGWIMGLFPSAVLMSGEPYSFALTGACLLGTSLLLLVGYERRSWLLLGFAGLVYGFALLVRPSVASVAIALLVFAGLALRRAPRRWLVTGGAAFLVAASLVVLPALIHNARHDQGWTVSTANEQNLWLGNNRYTPDYKTWDLGQHPADSFRPEVTRYLERFGLGDPSRAQRSAMLREARHFVASHPGTTAFRTFNRVKAFWGFDYTMSTDIRDSFGLSQAAILPLVALEAGTYWLVAALAIIGLVFAREHLRFGPLAFLLALVVTFQLSYAAAYSAGRWHFPLLGFVIPVAAAGGAWLRSTPGALRAVRRSHAFWLALAVFAAIQVEYAYVVWTHA